MNLLHLADDPECLQILQEVVDNLPCGIALFDSHQDLIVSNAMFRRMLDLPDDLSVDRLPSLKTLALFDVAPGDKGPDERATHEVPRAPRHQRREQIRPDGTILELENHSLQGGGVITLCQDVTARRCAEATLRERDSLFRLIYDNSSVAIFTVDAAGRIANANQRMAEMFATPMEQLIGRDYIALVHPSEKEASRQMMQAHLASNASKMTLERRYWRSDHTAFWGQLNSQHMPKNGNGDVRLVCAIADVSEHKAAEQALADRSRELKILNSELTSTVAELAKTNGALVAAREKLESLAQHDSLTGAWTRRKMQESVHLEMLRKARYGHPVSLIFIDLDQFKTINDSYGHAAGDSVLRTFCNIANQNMRTTDQLGRWGGEEFVIVTPNSGLMVASLLAERIRKATAAYDFPVARHVTASFGVAELRRDETWDSWFSRADAAVYAAKSEGRNRVVSDGEEENDTGLAERLEPSFVRLVWRSNYESGHPTIDKQHRKLFEHANSLLVAVIGERPADEIVPQIDALISDISAHFHDEEDILRAIGYKYAERHSEIHNVLLEQAQETREKFLQHSLSFGEIFNFLTYEVVAKHMLLEDRKFFEQLHSYLRSEKDGH
ncbi:MAG TPA: diguanylate cyclase [Telmatospirillum sp.]|nr:diguanylate cyclase [Telmatospirillum sp.]